MLVTRQLMLAVDFHSRGKNTMEVNEPHQLFGYQHSLKYIFFCVQLKTKFIQVWNIMRV